jgi:Dolichyl-phosphate-mannose-protein mannosyltransferase
MIGIKNIRNLGRPLLLALAVVATRIPFTSKYLFNMDSVQFALATGRFDVALHQPHPPGYFLYVMLGRFFLGFTGDENAAFVAISILFSALAVVAIYYLAKELFDTQSAIAAAAIAITSPVFWLHGEVALSYAPEAFMSVMFAFLCFRMQKGEGVLFWAAAVILAIAGGIRQNTMVFLFPLWVYSMRGLSLRRVTASLAIFGIAFAAWFIPMLHMTGGYERYSAALKAIWLDSNWRGIHLNWIAYNGRYMFLFMLGGLGAAATPIVAWAYFRIKGTVKGGRSDAVPFFMFWLLPAFIFHLLIFTHHAIPGYSLIYMVGLFIIAGRALTALSFAAGETPPGKRIFLMKATLYPVLAANAALFLLVPTQFSYEAVKGHDLMVSEYVDVVKRNFSPTDTEIIGSNRFFLSYRHAMYYLPEFRAHDTTVLSGPGGPHLLCGTGRMTSMEKEISFRPETRRFIDFINYDKSELAGRPPGARLINLPDGCILVYYDSVDDLRGVDRIAPLLRNEKVSSIRYDRN